MVAVGVFAIFGGLSAFVAQNQADSGDALAGSIALAAVGGFVFTVITVLSVPGLIAGYGLLKIRRWARVLGIVLSALSLLNVPFGTALGAYGLWILLKPETEALFARGG
jgi:hypothetical protein